MRARRGFVSAGIVVALLLGATTAGAADRPSFKPAARPDIRISESAVQFATEDLGSGEDHDDLAILDPGGRTFRYFRNLQGERLDLVRRTRLNRSVGGWDSAYEMGDEMSGFGITNPLEGTVTIRRTPETSDGHQSIRTVKVGAEPSDFTAIRTSLGYRAFLVTNRSDGTVTVISLGEKGQATLTETVPVGGEPASIASGGVSSHALVANSATDDVSLLAPNIDAQGKNLSPAYKVLQTLPVGDRPVDVFAQEFQGLDTGEIDFAVVNRGSDSLTTLSREDNGAYFVSGEYAVGEEPVSITPADVNRDGTFDFVVANSGSDDLSLLINDGEGLRPGGRVPVGDRPVAVIALGLDRYFKPDLVVANAGDGTVDSLLWNETSGECAGIPAKLKRLTEGKDFHGGSDNPNRTLGLGGDDSLSGGMGPDCLLGGDGRDWLNGGGDDDHLWGGPGRDRLTARNGADVVRGGSGDDFLCEDYMGEACGTYSYYFERGSKDRQYGGPGDDRIHADRGPNLIVGGPGDDRIVARHNGFDRIVCGPGRDRVSADPGDRLVGCE